MSWVRIDDHFYDHPKWADAPGDSIALWVAAMAWCNRNDSFDGYIPAAKLAGLCSVRNVKRTATDLCSRVAFIAHSDGYLIHEYAEYQQNDKVNAIKAKRSAAGRKGASVRWGKDGKEIANAIANGWQTDSKQNAPPPTTHHPLEYISDNSTPENTDVPGENFRRAEVLELYCDAQVTAARASGAAIGNETAYRRPIQVRAQNNPDLDRWLRTFPTAPASAVAAWLMGDKHSMGYFPEAGVTDIATVHRLPGAS